MPRQGYVYILTNQHHTVLYIGVTSELKERIQKHKNKYYRNSFCARYNIDKLVYIEFYQDIILAIKREKQLKAGNRAKKISLIESINPKWKDLFEDLE